MTINDLAQEYWDGQLDDEPTFRHLLGDLTKVADFESATQASEAASIARMLDIADRVEAVDPESLTEDERVTRSVLLSEARKRADYVGQRMVEFAADPIFGVQEELPLLASMLGVPDQATADAMTGKLHSIGRYLTELAARQADGVAAGRTAPEFAVRGSIEQIRAWLDTPLGEDALVAAINVPEGADEDALRAQWRSAVETSVRPGLAAYAEALAACLPTARPDDKVGLCHLPGGDESYAAALRYFTTTDKSAQEIHDIGLAQVAKLADEYRAMAPEVLGTDDLDEIFDKMRSDPALHFTDGQELVTASEVAMARAWEVMPEWFATLPQAPCTVTGTLTGAKAFYFPPAPTARAVVRSSSTSPTRNRGAPSNSSRWRSTKASPDTTSS